MSSRQLGVGCRLLARTLAAPLAGVHGGRGAIPLHCLPTPCEATPRALGPHNPASGGLAPGGRSFASGSVAAETYHAANRNALSSVVRVFSVVSHPDPLVPWQRKAQQEAGGSGFVVGPRALLTNAHVVAGASWVEVQRHGSADRFRAHVVSAAHDCDLALLSVDAERFWEAGETTTGSSSSSAPAPLELDEGPLLFQEAVAVAGFPSGGSNASLGSGAVSRTERIVYAHGGAALLSVQIEAAISNGSSGGPVLREGRVVGVAFQSLRGSEGLGYLIPAPLIRRFLSGAAASSRSSTPSGAPAVLHQPGPPSLGLRCQATVNPTLRRALGLAVRPQETGGVLVTSVHPLGAAAAAGVRCGDVLLSYDGVPIASDGTVPLPGSVGRAPFDHLVSLFSPKRLPGPPGGAVVSVLRSSTGETEELRAVPAAVPPLVPPHLHGSPCSYLLAAGGLLFAPLSQPLLSEAYGPDWASEAPWPLVTAALQGEASVPGQQVVLLVSVFPDPSNAGYQSLSHRTVRSVCGCPVLNLRHLRSLLVRSDGSADSSAPGAPPSSSLRSLELHGGLSLYFDPSGAAAEADSRAAEALGAPRLCSSDVAAEPTDEELRLWALVEAGKEPLPWVPLQ